MFFVESFLSFLFQFPGPFRQDFFCFDKVLPGKSSIRRMYTRIHPDRIARAGLYAEAAVDTAQGIDLVAYGIFFDRVFRIFPGLDVNTLGGASRRTEKAGRALHRPVLF